MKPVIMEALLEISSPSSSSDIAFSVEGKWYLNPSGPVKVLHRPLIYCNAEEISDAIRQMLESHIDNAAFDSRGIDLIYFRPIPEPSINAKTIPTFLEVEPTGAMHEITLSKYEVTPITRAILRESSDEMFSITTYRPLLYAMALGLTLGALAGLIGSLFGGFVGLFIGFSLNGKKVGS